MTLERGSCIAASDRHVLDQPVEAILQSVSCLSRAALNVPGAIANHMQIQGICDLQRAAASATSDHGLHQRTRDAHLSGLTGVQEIVFVREHEQCDTCKRVFLQQLIELFACLIHPLSIGAVYDIYECIRVFEIVAPVRSDRFLSCSAYNLS